MKIRYSNEEDKTWIKDILLHDKNVREKLGLSGNNEDSIIKTGSWSATFIGCINKKRVCFITIEFAIRKDSVYITDLFVDKKYRKKGYAKKILDFALAYAKEDWAANQSHLFTIENEDMNLFISKYGFKKMGTYKNFIKRGNKELDQTLWVKKLK